MIRTLFVLAAVAALLYGAAAVFLFLRQESFLFFPDHSRFDDCAGSRLTPLSPTTAEANGRKVHYHLRKGEDALGAIVVFHGNAGTACDRVFYAELFRDQPYDVILAEYPGYGGLSGPLSQGEILASADALIDHIRSTLPKPDAPLLVLGESLGSGVATYVARKPSVSGMILVSPYSSIRELASGVFPWLPVGLVLRHPFRADLWAKDVKVPTLILHGNQDETIPFAMGEAQSKRFANLRAFIALPNSGHNDWLERDNLLAISNLHAFVESFIPRK